MPQFLVAPDADFTGGALTTLVNAVLSDSSSLSGLTNGTSYRAVALSSASPVFTPEGPDIPAPIVSGSIRSMMMIGQGGTTLNNERAIFRLRDRSNVRCADPWFEFFHGRILSGGQVGMSIETTLPSGVTCNYRCAILTGISGTGKNQSAATVHRLTFFDMNDDAAFIAAGGSVSGDGRTITVPNGRRFRSDRLDGVVFEASDEYFIQTECVAADGSVANNPRGRISQPTLGDINIAVPAGDTADWVYATDWSSRLSSAPSSGCGPIAVLGTGEPGVKTVIVDGDSIISQSASPFTGPNNTDIGNSLGVVAFAKRALSEAGYSYIDVSVPGTNIGNFMGGYNKDGIRADLMQYGDAVITDHGHNDRRSGIAFDAVAGWSEASPSTWNSTGLRTRLEWHNEWLRSKIKPGGRIVRCTLSPQTNSTDAWATAENQTGRNDDSTWAADYATTSTGDQFKFSDLVMFRGLYSGLTPGADGLHDAGFDLYDALGGTVDGAWPAAGTADGTHPSETLHAAAAAALSLELSDLLGWIG